MPEINDVQIGETIAVEWGNAIRDRTIQRYDDAAERDELHPDPTAGDLAYLRDSGDVLVYHSGTWQPFLPTGAVIPFAGTSAPAGWLFCHGQAVSRTTYARLFAVIGTTYGAGNGSTTFNLPDLRQRFPLGKAASGTGSALGETGGRIDHTHNVPPHQHGLASHTHSMTHTHQVNPPSTFTTFEGQHNHGGQTGYDVAVGGQDRWEPFEGPDVHRHNISSDGNHRHSVDIAAFTSGASSASSTGPPSTTSTGNSGTLETSSNNPPYLVLNYIIKT